VIVTDVPDRVDAIVDPDEPTGSQPAHDGVVSQPEAEELGPRHVSVLTARQLREPVVDMLRIAPYIDQ
jgi:hypothetical protein